MTAEDKCKVFGELLEWARKSNESVLYLEERIYAVKMPSSMVTLVKAGSMQEAENKAKVLILKKKGLF